MLTPSPKIEERPCKGTPQISPSRGKELVHDYSTSVFLLKWEQFVAMREEPIRVTSGQGSQLTASHNSVKTESLNWEQKGGY